MSELFASIIIMVLLGSGVSFCARFGPKGPSPGRHLEVFCEAESVGAQVFVDGVLAGELRGSQSVKKYKNGTVFNTTECNAVGIRVLRGEVSNDYIRAHIGKRELSVACPGGRRLVQNITVDTENYVHIECQRGRIIGRP